MSKSGKNTIKEDVAINIITVVFVTVFTISIILPIWNIIVLSLNDGFDSAYGGVYFFPRAFTLDNYKAVLRDQSMLWAFFISVAKTVVGTVTHVFFTAMVAYGMSKNDLIGRSLYIKLGVITMFFGGGMIPTFMLIRSLGLLDNFLVYIIPALFSFYDMIIIMNFFRELPASLEESAEIDGAGYWRIFIQIAIPLSMPVVATIALFNGVGQWNDFMTTRLYINKESLYPLQMKLYQIIVQTQAANMRDNAVSAVASIPVTSKGIELATIVITTLPIVIVYPFLQKHFISGMLVGAVKG